MLKGVLGGPAGLSKRARGEHETRGTRERRARDSRYAHGREEEDEHVRSCTSTRTGGGRGGGLGREGRPAAAGALGVRVVELEARAVVALDEVDLCRLEVLEAHR